MSLKSKKLKFNNGFTLLISIIVTGILLLISFVIANLALKQLVIVYSGSESQKAFYAADSGMECAMYWDIKNPTNPTISAFATSTAGSITCNSQTVSTGSQTVPTNPSQSSRVGGGGSANPTSIFYITYTDGCAIVTVTKETDGDTMINSRGYNTCGASLRRFERGITITY